MFYPEYDRVACLREFWQLALKTPKSKAKPFIAKILKQYGVYPRDREMPFHAFLDWFFDPDPRVSQTGELAKRNAWGITHSLWLERLSSMHSEMWSELTEDEGPRRVLAFYNEVDAHILAVIKEIAELALADTE